MNIFLVGFMGSGKSTYGERLAKQMNIDFVDLDQLIEQRTGMSISTIFESQGEAYFRILERDMLRELGGKENQIISTGGGAPCYHDNMQWMKEHGTTIHLKLETETLFKNLQSQQDSRPLIQGMDEDELEDFIHTKMFERAYYYMQADIIIDPQHLKPTILKDQLTTR